MQPYFFPYLGYFQLVYASDVFIFYDDVNFIKGGWINRNRILINGKPAFITVALKGASKNKMIRDIAVVGNQGKLLRSIEVAYRRAPFFNETMNAIGDVFSEPVTLISELASRSVRVVMHYLGLSRDYRVSGEDFAQTQNLGRADRLVAITQLCNARRYLNATGGQELYDKAYFRERSVELKFLRPRLPAYRQFGQEFVPGLSIIDVLMFNPVERVREMLADASLD